MENIGALKIELHETEERLLTELRTLRRGLRGTQDGSRGRPRLTIGQRIADAVAATMGSWTFIIIQSFLLMFWIALNVTAYVQQWDPYPFILLNLALSFQAAYAAPFIMMSQKIGSKTLIASLPRTILRSTSKPSLRSSYSIRRLTSFARQKFCISRRLLMGSWLSCARARADPVQLRTPDRNFGQKKSPLINAPAICPLYP